MIVRLETYIAKLVDGQPVALEHAETKWVSREEITELKFAPADVPAVEKIVNERKY